MEKIIKTPVGVARFFYELAFSYKCADFHPDDPCEVYKDKDGNPLFSATDAEIANKLMEQSFEACETYGIDIYDICMRVLALYHYCNGNDTLCKLYDNNINKVSYETVRS